MSTISLKPQRPPSNLGRRLWGMAAATAHLLMPQRAGILICVVLPTFITVLYQGLIAADIYVSESAFSIRLDQGNQGGDLGMIFPGLQYTGAAQDQLTVNTFIHSRAIVQALRDHSDLVSIFHHDNADFVASLGANPDMEELLAYYRKMVTITYDEQSRISTLSVRAFSAEDAQRLNQAILTEAEQFVNSLSNSMRNDGIEFARKQLKRSEGELIAANDELTKFRQENRNFDPTRASEGVANLLEGIYQRIITRRTELEALRGVMTSKNQEIRNLEREIAALERQFKEQNARLTTDRPDALANQLETYTKLESQHKFAMERYRLSLVALEAAQTEAGRKSIYLVPIATPSQPDIATEPRRLYRIASVFFLSLAAYGLLLLIGASVGDHVRSY